MALRPARYMLLVQPSLVDNNEHERPSGLIVPTEAEPGRKLHRGVVLAIGGGIEDDIAVGNVAHYTDFAAIDDRHIVPTRNLLAYEDQESESA